MSDMVVPEGAEGCDSRKFYSDDASSSPMSKVGDPMAPRERSPGKQILAR